jgi:DMSO/TMAO reductase YedYZ molybdopterin-dependent catalytic subunit
VKLDRRSFIKLIPAVAVAVACTSVLFLRQPPTEPLATCQVTPMTRATNRTVMTSSVEPTGTSTGFAFPVTWNRDSATVVDSSDYRLRIDGDVPRPLGLTLTNLSARRNAQKILKIRCVEGGRQKFPGKAYP